MKHGSEVLYDMIPFHERSSLISDLIFLRDHGVCTVLYSTYIMNDDMNLCGSRDHVILVGQVPKV